MRRRVLRLLAAICLPLFLSWSCGFDSTLREYLSTYFWLPFPKRAELGRKRVPRKASLPYAGFAPAEGDTPLDRLRLLYRRIAHPDVRDIPADALRQAVQAARAAKPAPRDLEEVDLIDAKIDLRIGTPDDPQPLREARRKLEKFLQVARRPEYRSEARGWIARIQYLLGEQSAAGKFYLDELQRANSNLSQEVLLTSLAMTYGNDGGEKLRTQIADYFDTAEHAIFAIEILTNPDDPWRRWTEEKTVPLPAIPAQQVLGLMEQHKELFASREYALLSMRTALRGGDPAAVLRFAKLIDGNPAVQQDPDFLWMLASSYFLTKDYHAAEKPLLEMLTIIRDHRNPRRAAAVYGLCGIYAKLGDPVEQLRYALMLKVALKTLGVSSAWDFTNYVRGDLSVYWDAPGFDFGLLVDTEAPIPAIREFLAKYPNTEEVDQVRYALAVRLAREDQYEESAQIYEALRVPWRAQRMRTLAGYFRDGQDPQATGEARHLARYRMAELLVAHGGGVYFNDRLWDRLQRYALVADTDVRLTREERERLVAGERKLRDDQEERWRAYLILREVAREEGPTPLGRQSAQLGVKALTGISERFGRTEEIRSGLKELTALLRRRKTP